MSVLSALIGTSTVIRHVQQLVFKVAESEAPVLITGEPGTGKEIIAKAVHDKSSRAAGPFVPVKCAAIGEDILEAELFGHERGAFPGAHHAREGRFEVASGGTLFLDEVSRLSPNLQAQLVRALQEGCIQPIGSQRTVPVNMRLICSTSRNIDVLVREGQFREDLYYRLAGCAVYIPPLRERREDIPTLVDHFIQKFNQLKTKSIVGISADALTALLQHVWAHNIRELENLIERIVVLKNSGSIEVCDLPPRLRSLVTDNIDDFYEKANSIQARQPQMTRENQNSRQTSSTQTSPANFRNSNQHSSMPREGNLQQNQTYPQNSRNNPAFPPQYNHASQAANNYNNAPVAFDDASEIDQFIKKDIDLGSGIDFYRVVEEFENRLIAEALRRTNHNKNRAAQLLSMNRTTLVEKLKKRAASSPVKVENGRVKRNPAFTIFDGLGAEKNDFESLDYVVHSTSDIIRGDRD